MIKYKRPNFTLAADKLSQVSGLQQINRMIQELDSINELLWQQFADLRQICHCGAIDREQDLLIIFAKNNAAFYKVNQFIPQIQDALSDRRINFSKILVKVCPETHHNKQKPRVVTTEQYQMLEKFAEMINRPDLLKPQKAHIEEDSNNEWQINL